MKGIRYYKLIIALCFVMINVYTVSSQLRFGIKGGFDVTDNRLNTDILNADNRLGFQIGATMEGKLPIIGLGFDLSALYGQQQYDKAFDDKDGYQYTLSDYNYIAVPLNLKYKIGLAGSLGLFIAAGPYIQFKLDGGDLGRTKNTVTDQWNTKSFGAGVNAGAGVELFHHLELGMYYRKALTDNYGTDNGIDDLVKNKPYNWNVSATYFF